MFDYCIYFVYKMMEALLKNEKCVLNRGSIGYTKIYYEITDNLFKIDFNVKREETANPEKEEETPKESIFGTEPKLESYKDFTEVHLKWVKELLAGNEAILYHVRSASGEDLGKDICNRAVELLDHKNKDQQNLGLHFIDKYALYESIDVQKISFAQAELGNVENVVRLIGRQSKMEKEKKIKMQKDLVDQLLESNFNKNSKAADSLCQKFDIPLEDYPLLVDQKKRNSVRFFLGNFLRKKEEDKEYMALDRIENLFIGLNDCQAHLCEQLFFAGRKMEAKGVFDRAKLEAEEVNVISKGKDVGD